MSSGKGNQSVDQEALDKAQLGRFRFAGLLRAFNMLMCSVLCLFPN